jgi:catechol 2,3-dioxygenase-like lactoylglutathione lyase family enzyme
MENQTTTRSSVGDGSAQAGRVTGIACLWIPVQDVETSTRWYTQVLGLELLREPRRSEDGNANALCRLAPDGPGLFLTQVDTAAPMHFDHRGHRTAMIEFRVDDIEALYAHLVKEGVEVFDRRDDPPCGRYLHLLDPDGNKVQVFAPI